MGKLPNLRGTFRRTTTDDTVNQVSITTAEDSKTDPVNVEDGPAGKDAAELQSEVPGEDLQHGVQDVEAITLSWSKASLIAIFLKYAFFYTLVRSSIIIAMLMLMFPQYLVTVLCQCIPIIYYV